MTTDQPQWDEVLRRVGSWHGVTTAPHRFGGVEFLVGRRELGHLHPGPSPVADLPFPRAVRDDLIAEGRAQVHRWMPDSGWVTAPLDGVESVEGVVGLFRLAYDRAVAAAERRAALGR